MGQGSTHNVWMVISIWGEDPCFCFLLSLTLWIRVYFNISIDFSKKLSGYWWKVWDQQYLGGWEGWGLHFEADPNENPALVNLNVVSLGDCWALAEVCAPLRSILANVVSSTMNKRTTMTNCVFRQIYHQGSRIRGDRGARWSCQSFLDSSIRRGSGNTVTGPWGYCRFQLDTALGLRCPQGSNERVGKDLLQSLEKNKKAIRWS